MKFKYSRSVQIYYTVALILGVLIVAGGTSYFWFNGAINTNNIAAVVESQSLIQEIEKRNDLEKIEDYVQNDKVRSAVILVDTFELNLKEINDLFESGESYELLTKDFLDHKNQLNGLLSYPRFETIVEILLKKMDSFYTFVKDNNWRTLTRVSYKLKIVLDNERKKNSLTHKKLSALYWRLSQDLTYMKNVTSGSILAEADKNNIINKINSLDAEVKMLKGLSSDLKTYYNSYFHFKESFQTWLSDIKPGISLKRLESQRDAQKLLLFLIGSVTYFILAMIGGLILARRNGKKGMKYNEESIVRLLNYDLIKKDEKNLEGHSEKFHSDFLKFKNYLEKRIKFGGFFQEALPIPAILLDEDLQLAWANAHFYREWELEGHKGKENISWDYLQKFTNLGEEDPVILGMKNNVAGIYQVQIRTSPQKDLIPFEMYVSPINDNNKTKMMIFFYPLKYMEETLYNQSKTLLGPINKVLDLFVADNYRDETKENIKKDFEIADISHIWNKFEKVNELFKFQKDGLLKEIDNLENQLYDKIKLIHDCQKIIDRGINIQKMGFSKFNDLKETVVDVVDTRQDMEQVYLSTVVNSKEFFGGKEELLKVVNNLKERLSQKEQILTRLTEIQSDFKKEREFIEQQKNIIYQGMQQTLQFKKSSAIGEDLKASLDTLKNEIRGIDKIIERVNKFTKTLDVLLSKSELMVQNEATNDVSKLIEDLKRHQDKIETDMFNLSKLTKKGHENDEKMISNLKNVYETFLNNHHRMIQATQLIADKEVTASGGVENEA